jgi:predicted RNA-binding protein YlqC (UPF0109 family)
MLVKRLGLRPDLISVAEQHTSPARLRVELNQTDLGSVIFTRVGNTKGGRCADAAPAG